MKHGEAQSAQVLTRLITQTDQIATPWLTSHLGLRQGSFLFVGDKSVFIEIQNRNPFVYNISSRNMQLQCVNAAPRPASVGLQTAATQDKLLRWVSGLGSL